jgi:tRNA threonylcarbamoyladenosine biosynthesis protein TsaB
VRILAIETTERVPTVAGIEFGELVERKTLDPGKRSAQTLAPGMRAFLDEVGWKPASVDLVAVAVGPGSFTGIRVGVTTAKAFAYAAGAEVLGVSTLETIAFGCPDELTAVSIGVDAQRREVTAQLFRRDADGRLHSEGDSRLVPIEAWLSEIPLEAKLAGPILRKLPSERIESAPVVDSAYWGPTATSVGLLAYRKYAEGARNTLWDLLPVYSRASAAEEKLGKGG